MTSNIPFYSCITTLPPSLSFGCRAGIGEVGNRKWERDKTEIGVEIGHGEWEVGVGNGRLDILPECKAPAATASSLLFIVQCGAPPACIVAVSIEVDGGTDGESNQHRRPSKSMRANAENKLNTAALQNR